MDARRSRRRLVVASILAVAMALLIAACGGDDEGTASEGDNGTDVAAETTTDDSSSEGLVVGYADGFGDNSARQVMQAELRDEISKLPQVKDLIYTNAAGSPQQMIADINSLRNQGVDILLMMADPGPAVNNAVRQATEAGITVGINAIPIAKDGSFPEKGTLTNEPDVFAVFVNEEGCESGEAYAEYVASKADSGKALFLGGPEGNTYSSLMYECAKAYFEENAPDIEFLPPEWTDWDVQKAQQAAQSALAKHGEIDILMSDYGAPIPSVLDVFGNTPWPKVIVAQEYNGLNRLWVEGDQEFDLGIADARTWGTRAALRAALAVHEGKEMCTEEQWTTGATRPAAEVTDECVPSFPQWNIPIVDAAEVGDEVWDSDFPDDWYPSSELSAEQAREALGL